MNTDDLRISRSIKFRNQIERALRLLYPNANFSALCPEELVVCGHQVSISFYSPHYRVGIVPEDIYYFDKFDKTMLEMFQMRKNLRQRYCTNNDIKFIVVPKMHFDMNDATYPRALIKFLKSSGLMRP